jgi:CelD/BcsL family acetyltransferase involved in cellulose biosynthesis
VAVADEIHKYEGLWREFEGHGLESLTQSYDYVQLWSEHFGVPAESQVFLLGTARGEPLLLLPLRRVRFWGTTMLTWLSGTHGGAHLFPAHVEALAKLEPDQRERLWTSILEAAGDADFLYLPDLPAAPGGHRRLFSGLGQAEARGHVYRAEFENWDECQRFHQIQDQRGRDRQEEQRLAGMGEVVFTEYMPGYDFAAVFGAMSELGQTDLPPGARERAFLHRAFEGGFTLSGRIFALELDNRPIAVRLGLAVGPDMFFVASAASTDVRVLGISPGAICLTRGLERSFGGAIRRVAFGLGASPEKRLWCNREVGLEDRYVPLSKRGEWAAKLHAFLQRRRAA